MTFLSIHYRQSLYISTQTLNFNNFNNTKNVWLRPMGQPSLIATTHLAWLQWSWVDTRTPPPTVT